MSVNRSQKPIFLSLSRFPLFLSLVNEIKPIQTSLSTRKRRFYCFFLPKAIAFSRKTSQVLHVNVWLIKEMRHLWLLSKNGVVFFFPFFSSHCLFALWWISISLFLQSFETDPLVFSLFSIEKFVSFITEETELFEILAFWVWFWFLVSYFQVAFRRTELEKLTFFLFSWVLLIIYP